MYSACSHPAPRFCPPFRRPHNPTTIPTPTAPSLLKPLHERLRRCRGRKSLVHQVDATGEQDLKKRFDITGFPRLKFFPAGGGMEPYSGTRDLESMEEFLKEKVRGGGGWVIG